MSRKWFWTGVICLAGAIILSNKKIQKIVDDMFFGDIF